MLNRLHSSIISHFLRTIRSADRMFCCKSATYILICMQVDYLFRIICCTFADVYETGQDHISSNVHLQRCVTPSARTARLDIRTDVAARRDSSAGRLQHRRHHAGAARVCRPCARGRGVRSLSPTRERRYVSTDVDPTATSYVCSMPR